MASGVASAPSNYAFPTEKIDECVRQMTADMSSLKSWRSETSPGPGISHYTTAVPGTSLRKNAAVWELPCTPARAADLLFDCALRIAWDTTSVSLTELASSSTADGDLFSLLSVRQKRVLIVSQREYIIATMKRTRQSDGAVFAVATDAGEAAPPHPDFIRGFIFDGSAWCAEPREGGCTLYYCVFADPRGGTFGIPHAIVNAAIGATFSGFKSGLESALSPKKS
jgi:hypothetical protein